MPSSASWLIRGTRPTVDTVIAAGGHAEPVGRRVGEPAYGADHGLVVGHRLAHAHEHDVGDPARTARDLAAGQRPGAGDDLLDDLGGGHVALQAALAGGAERAGHPAARPARRRTSWPGRGSASAPTRRARRRTASTASCGWCPCRPRACAAASSGAGSSASTSLLAVGGRQVGHLGRVVDQPGEVVGGELLGAEAGQPELGDQRLALGGGRGRRGAAAACLRPRGSSKTSGRFFGWSGMIGPVSHPAGPGPNPQRARRVTSRSGIASRSQAGRSGAVPVSADAQHRPRGPVPDQDQVAGVLGRAAGAPPPRPGGASRRAAPRRGRPVSSGRSNARRTAARKSSSVVEPVHAADAAPPGRRRPGPAGRSAGRRSRAPSARASCTTSPRPAAVPEARRASTSPRRCRVQPPRRGGPLRVDERPAVPHEEQPAGRARRAHWKTR